MVCIQVLSEDHAIAFAGTQGNFELNAMRRIIINNFPHAATILGGACTKRRQYRIEGTELNREQIHSFVNPSAMVGQQGRVGYTPVKEEVSARRSRHWAGRWGPQPPARRA